VERAFSGWEKKHLEREKAQGIETWKSPTDQVERPGQGDREEERATVVWVRRGKKRGRVPREKGNLRLGGQASSRTSKLSKRKKGQRRTKRQSRLVVQGRGGPEKKETRNQRVFGPKKHRDQSCREGCGKKQRDQRVVEQRPRREGNASLERGSRQKKEH